MIGITGGNGVLGRIVQQKLQESKVEFSVFLDDITDFEIVDKWICENNISYIIHLASKVAIKDVQENLAYAYDVNVNGTINLIKSISKNNLEIGFFYASSSHVYKSSEFPLNENDAIEPINSYGLTKYVSEQLLLDFSKNYSKIRLCIGRIFSFYHHSQKPPFLYPNLINRFKNDDLNQPFQLFGALSTRDFLNAEEICDIIIKLVNIKHKGVVNIASGKATKIIDFVQNIAPKKLDFVYDSEEKQNHLNADITLLKKILENE
jgi:nucleoside-diphosphate-sugar epimerase